MNLLERTRAERVEAESLAGVNNGQLAGQSQHGTLASGVGELRSGSTKQRDEAGGVDDATAGLLVAAQTEHAVLASKPHTLDVNILGQVPDFLRENKYPIDSQYHASYIIPRACRPRRRRRRA